MGLVSPAPLRYTFASNYGHHPEGNVVPDLPRPIRPSLTRAALACTLTLAVSACGSSGLFGGGAAADATRQASRTAGAENVAVNRYLWAAAIDTLSFLPVESVDPFTGIIVTGFGRPPGGGTAYRATIHISDPALDARSLNVALATGSGPVAAETQRAVEDAILARARQLRIGDGAF